MPAFTDFNVSPYYDDFSRSKNFHRVLFRPAFAVQARELSQSQSILQSQIEHFGDHVFKNGSRVLGGELTNQDVTFLRVYTTEQVNSTDLDVQSLIGTDIVSNTALGNDTRRAKVLHGITGGTSDNDNYYVLMVQYVDGGGDFGSEFAPGDVVRGTTGTNTYIIKESVNFRRTFGPKAWSICVHIQVDRIHMQLEQCHTPPDPTRTILAAPELYRS